MSCWVAHGDKVGRFAGKKIDVYKVCTRFGLDESSEISVCGHPVDKEEDGTWVVSVSTLREEQVPGQDGKTRDTAFRVVASLMIHVRRGTRCIKFDVDGFIDVPTICAAFSLDSDAPLVLAGVHVQSVATRSPAQIATATQDGRSPDSAFVIEDTPVKKEAAELPPIAKRFKPAYFVSQPSSETKDLKSYTRCMHHKYFNDMRAGLGIPIRITARAFGNFVDNMRKSYKFKLLDFQFATELISKMTRVYDEESGRGVAFLNVLKTYLDGSFTVLNKFEAEEVKRFTKHSDAQGYHLKTPDIQVVKVLQNGVTVKLCTISVKPEMGMNGEGLTESLFYYTVDAAHNYACDHYTGSPQLLIEVVGPNIRVGGAVYHDKATYEPLTDFLCLLPFRQTDHVNKVATLGVALRKALRELTDLYASAPVVEARDDDPERDPTFWPYPIKEWYPNNSTVRLYREGRQVFYVNDTRVVKFVQRYGTLAHDQWQALGFAPQHIVRQYPGGWMMVDMERLLSSDGWHLLFDLRQSFLSEGKQQGWEKIKATVINTLKLLQEQQPLMVHGDLRVNNIMYNEKTEKVCFLDFDWAGEEGTVCYPPMLNAAINWPAGVGPNAVIRPNHDMELLKAELTLLEDDW